MSILLRRIVGAVARCSGRPVGPEGGHTQAMRLQLRIERITRKLREFRRQAQAFPAEIEVVDGSGQECPPSTGSICHMARRSLSVGHTTEQRKIVPR